MQSPSADSHTIGTPRIRISRAHASLVAVVWLAVVSFAHRAALGIVPRSSSADPIEDFFFDTTVTIPALHYALFALVVFNRRHALRATLAKRSAPWIGGLVAALAVAVLGWAQYTQQVDLEIDSLVLTVVGCALIAGGIRLLDRMILPLGLLALARPWPPMLVHHLHEWLQTLTGSFAKSLLEPFTEVVRSGHYLFFQGRVFEVIEGCSGLRLEVTLLTATLVYLEFVSRSRRQTFGVLLIALVIGPILNGLRVVSIMLNPLSEVSQVHSTQGLIFITLGVAIIAVLDRVLEPRLWPDGDRSWRRPESERAGQRSAVPLRRLLGPLLVAVTALLVSIVPMHRPRPVPAAHWGLHEIYPVLGDWRRTGTVPTDTDFIGSVRFRDELHWTYERTTDGRQATLLVATDDRRRRDRSGLSPRTRSLGAGWQTLSSETIELTDPPTEANRSVQQRESERMLVLHYRIGAQPLALEALRWLSAVDLWPGWAPAEIIVVRIAITLDESLPARSLAALNDLQANVARALERARP